MMFWDMNNCPHLFLAFKIQPDKKIVQNKSIA